MQLALVTLKSLTYAQKTKKLLARADISARLIKLAEGNLSGCTYGVEFDKRYYYDVIAILRQNDISYGTVKYEGYK